jgi:glucose/arabinose dehydrogenase
MGNWMPQVGQLIERGCRPTAANANTTAKAVEAQVLLSKLNYPSGMARGPDGKIYIGEADKIWRAAVPALGQAPQPEMLASGLPADGASAQGAGVCAGRQPLRQYGLGHRCLPG